MIYTMVEPMPVTHQFLPLVRSVGSGSTQRDQTQRRPSFREGDTLSLDAVCVKCLWDSQVETFSCLSLGGRMRAGNILLRIICDQEVVKADQ